jgi:flagellar motor switch protein FliN/FliY
MNGNTNLHSVNGTGHGGNHDAPAIIQLPEAAGARRPGEQLLSSLDAVQGVKVRVSVTAGEATLTVGELMALREGQVVKLDSLVDTPFDVCLEGQVVARGELVAVDDNFGIRIVELPVVN